MLTPVLLMTVFVGEDESPTFEVHAVPNIGDTFEARWPYDGEEGRLGWSGTVEKIRWVYRPERQALYAMVYLTPG